MKASFVFTIYDQPMLERILFTIEREAKAPIVHRSPEKFCWRNDLGRIVMDIIPYDGENLEIDLDANSSTLFPCKARISIKNRDREPSLQAMYRDAIHALYRIVEHKNVEHEYHPGVCCQYPAIKNWLEYLDRPETDIRWMWDYKALVFASLFYSSFTQRQDSRESLLSSMLLNGDYKLTYHQDYEDANGAGIIDIEFTGLPDVLKEPLSDYFAKHNNGSTKENFIRIIGSAKALVLDNLKCTVFKREE